MKIGKALYFKIYTTVELVQFQRGISIELKLFSNVRSLFIGHVWDLAITTHVSFPPAFDYDVTIGRFTQQTSTWHSKFLFISPRHSLSCMQAACPFSSIRPFKEAYFICSPLWQCQRRSFISRFRLILITPTGLSKLTSAL